MNKIFSITTKIFHIAITLENFKQRNNKNDLLSKHCKLHIHSPSTPLTAQPKPPHTTTTNQLTTHYLYIPKIHVNTYNKIPKFQIPHPIAINIHRSTWLHRIGTPSSYTAKFSFSCIPPSFPGRYPSFCVLPSQRNRSLRLGIILLRQCDAKKAPSSAILIYHCENSRVACFLSVERFTCFREFPENRFDLDKYIMCVSLFL